MGNDPLVHLPSEIVIDIFSRLTVRTIQSCKRVCKSWLDLIETTEFVNFHISKSVPVVILSDWYSPTAVYNIIEFVEDPDLDYRLNLLEIPFKEKVHSSVNGLLFFCKQHFRHADNLLVCNPVTREYITIDRPKTSVYRTRGSLNTYGFGVSRVSGQYKLVWLIFEIKVRKPRNERYKQVQCKVYTIGTGSWKRIVSPIVFHYEMNSVGAFVNGKLHWLTRDWNEEGYSARVLCLDLETELFSSFSTPLDDCNENGAVSALGDHLYLCHAKYHSRADERDVCFWLMKEYGNEKSWIKLFNFSWDLPFCRGNPIRFFRDRDILIDMGGLFYYCNMSKTIGEVDLYELNSKARQLAFIYASSFIALKKFPMEKVMSF